MTEGEGERLGPVEADRRAALEGTAFGPSLYSGVIAGQAVAD